ncbi:hypothetical protein [Pseudonocardia sp. TRM90224]|uniref:hypothetical protein n=1 Tax=Pseudonocardia sp. TRM90224 TaxID=2812678 RepID=UPI001E454C96|nr:hypothetical protein [Pseudonocardia sp. TRM90224]
MGTSERIRRYLTSRKNIAGMAGAVLGTGLHVAGLIGDIWPVVAVGLYGVGALVAPADPRNEAPRLTDALRDDGEQLGEGTAARGRDLPIGTVEAVRRILDVLRLVLDRLDEVADQPADRAAAPERLAIVAEIIRVDLPVCLDTYLGRSPSASAEKAAAELVTQLDVIASSVDRLAAAVPDVHAERAEELTRQLKQRHGEP